MSTKIYNGFRLPLMGLTELQQFSGQFKKRCYEELLKQYYKQIACLIAETIDNSLLGLSPPLDYAGEKIRAWNTSENENNSWFSAANKIAFIKSTKAKNSHLRDPEWDFECSLCFLPSSSHLLLISFCEKNCANDVLKDLGAEEYPYWDNTDKADGISNEDWQSRGNEWHTVLPDLGIPAQCGFVIQCKDYFSAEQNQILKFFPTFEKRLNRCSGEIFISEFFAKESLENLDWIEITKRLRQVQDEIKTEDGKKRREEIRSQIRPKMKELLTEVDINEIMPVKEDPIGWNEQV